jgi:hypothetical protein
MTAISEALKRMNNTPPQVSGATLELARLLWHYAKPDDPVITNTPPPLYRRCAVALIKHRNQFLPLITKE